jgi:protein-S-isoprenylcysteine O-methyltransferase Ste14
MSPQDEDHPGVRFPPPFVFLGFVLLGPLVDRLFRLEPIELPPLVVGAAALLLIGGGVGLALAAVRRFGAAGTRVEPWAPSSAIVQDGVYRFTRNPMYVGMALLAAGLALMSRSPGALLLVPLAVLSIDRFVIPREESYLERRFGDAYRDYCRRVRRWL